MLYKKVTSKVQYVTVFFMTFPLYSQALYSITPVVDNSYHTIGAWAWEDYLCTPSHIPWLEKCTKNHTISILHKTVYIPTLGDLSAKPLVVSNTKQDGVIFFTEKGFVYKLQDPILFSKQATPLFGFNRLTFLANADKNFTTPSTPTINSAENPYSFIQKFTVSFIGTPKLSDGHIIAMTANGFLQSLNSTTGIFEWSVDISNVAEMQWSHADFTVYKGHIYIVAPVSGILDIDANTGHVLHTWNQPTNNTDNTNFVLNNDFWDKGAAVPPLLMNNILYIANWDNYIEAFDTNTQKYIWTIPGGSSVMPIVLNNPHVISPSVVFALHSGDIQQISPNGALLHAWRVDGVPTSMAYKDNNLWVGTQNSQMYTFNLVDHTAKYFFTAGIPLQSLVLGGHVCFVLASIGVQCFTP
jgi:outer membrane protein assembly factor BamB